MTTYREADAPVEWFICSSCYQTLSRHIETPCHRCGLTRVPLDDESVLTELRARANRRLISRADLENTGLVAPLVAWWFRWTKKKSASATMWRRRLAASAEVHDDADVRILEDDRPWPPPEYFTHCIPLEDPETLSIADLLRWLKVVEE